MKLDTSHTAMGVWSTASSDVTQLTVEASVEPFDDPQSPPATMQTEAVAEKFARLVDEWRRERPPACSSITEIVTQPAYQQIIGMGEAAIPFILTELERELDDWFPALNSIACVDPVAPEDRGRMRAMADAWLRWGRRHGHIR